jgi:hypothetical protein
MQRLVVDRIAPERNPWGRVKNRVLGVTVGGAIRGAIRLSGRRHFQVVKWAGGKP